MRSSVVLYIYQPISKPQDCVGVTGVSHPSSKKVIIFTHYHRKTRYCVGVTGVSHQSPKSTRYRMYFRVVLKITILRRGVTPVTPLSVPPLSHLGSKITFNLKQVFQTLSLPNQSQNFTHKSASELYFTGCDTPHVTPPKIGVSV